MPISSPHVSQQPCAARARRRAGSPVVRDSEARRRDVADRACGYAVGGRGACPPSGPAAGPRAVACRSLFTRVLGRRVYDVPAHVGCRRDAPDRRRHGLDRVSPAGARGGELDRDRLPVRQLRRRPHRARDGPDDGPRRVLRGAALGRAAADHLAAVGRRLRRGLRAAAGRRRRRRVDPHLRAGSPGTCDSARQAAEPLEREGKGGERVRVVDSPTRGRRARADRRSRPRSGRRRGGDADAVVEPRARSARETLKMWFAVDTLEFLKRSGRIGAASAWIGSTLKIKPILTLEQRDHPGRARAHERARVRADGRLRAAAPRVRRRRLGRAAHPVARRRPSGSPSAAARSSRATRCSSPRSARCSASTRARACSGVGGVPPSLLA